MKHCKIVVSLLGIGLVWSLTADDTYWTGVQDTAWSNSGNWSDASVFSKAVGVKARFKSSYWQSSNQPTVDIDQPGSSACNFIRLSFSDAGWNIGGSAVLTLSNGNVDLTNDNLRYIESAGSGTNTVNAPLALDGGKSGTFYLQASAGSTLRLNGSLTFTRAARNYQLYGGGRFILSNSIVGSDLIIKDSVAEFARADGSVYNSTAGKKVRVNNSTLIWRADNQINGISGRDALLRVDGGSVVNMNGHTDTVNQLVFALDTVYSGIVDTGVGGNLKVVSLKPMMTVGSSTRQPADTAIVRGLISSSAGLYDTSTIAIRRGLAAEDLRIEGCIASAGSIAVDTAANMTAADAGVVVFAGTNTYAGTTKVLAGTLKVMTVGAPAIANGKVEVSATGRLEGTSTIDPSSGKTIEMSGTLAPGDPVGTLTVGSSGSENNVNFKAGSTFEVRLTDAGVAKLDVYGAVSVAAGTTLSLVASGKKLPPGRHVILSASNGITGDFDLVTGLPDGCSLSRAADGKSITLKVPRKGLLMMLW